MAQHTRSLLSQILTSGKGQEAHIYPNNRLMGPLTFDDDNFLLPSPLQIIISKSLSAGPFEKQEYHDNLSSSLSRRSTNVTLNESQSNFSDKQEFQDFKTYSKQLPNVQSKVQKSRLSCFLKHNSVKNVLMGLITYYLLRGFSFK